MTYYHISHIPGLRELRPFQGRVYVTTRGWIAYWAAWVSGKHDRPHDELYVYRVDVPDDAVIGCGIESAVVGDFYVETDKPLPVTQLDWDFRRNRERKRHINKYRLCDR